MAGMNPPRRAGLDLQPPLRWSVYAGLYLFFAGTMIAVRLSDVLGLLADLIGLPAGFAMAVFATPAFVVGTVAWWAIVERRGGYSYRLGSGVGGTTALLTGLLWTAVFGAIWGLELLGIDVVLLLVATVLASAAVAGAVAGLPFMYARRRLGDGLAGQSSRPVNQE